MPAHMPYQLDWPGTNRDVGQDRLLHSTPISFQSPVFRNAWGEQVNYDSAA